MRIGKHISDLLHQHDKVILPGFGCFSTRYVPARFIPEKGLVEPPAKVAEYNSEPAGDDGLLISHMARQESKSTEEVQAYVGKIVEEVHRNIREGRKVELEQLGRFHADESGHYLFEPSPGVNFLDDADGLPGVAAPEQSEPAGSPLPPPRKEKTKDTTVPKETGPTAAPGAREDQAAVQQTQIPEEMSEEKERSSLPPAIKWVAYLIVPVIVLLIILLLNLDFFFGQGGLFHGRDRVPAEEVPVRVEEPAAEAIVPEPEVEIIEPPLPEPASLMSPSPEAGRPVYYLMVGSFRNEELAKALVKELRADGAKLSGILETSVAGYHRVSYGFFYEPGEAEAQKEKLPEALRDIAWVLHR